MSNPGDYSISNFDNDIHPLIKTNLCLIVLCYQQLINVSLIKCSKIVEPSYHKDLNPIEPPIDFTSYPIYN